jgi:hypothetical protein
VHACMHILFMLYCRRLRHACRGSTSTQIIRISGEKMVKRKGDSKRRADHNEMMVHKTKRKSGLECCEGIQTILLSRERRNDSNLG